MSTLLFDTFANTWQYSVTATVTTALLIAGYYYLQNVYSHWERLGIKGPKPVFVFGNVLELLKKSGQEVENEWRTNYGKVYGVYHGLTPRLIIADPEVLLQISVKDFEYAPNHNNTSDFLGTYASNFIFNIGGDRWKRTRALLSPTFTSSKIRRMFKLLGTCAADLVEAAKDNMASGVLNIKDLFSLYTLDGITTCCYGLKLPRTGNPEDKGSREDFVQATTIFRPAVTRFLIFFSVPKPILRLFNFAVLPDHKFEPLVSRLSHIIKRRKEMPVKPDDYLQLLIDAKPTDSLELDELDSKENHHAGLSSETLQNDHKKMVDSKAKLNELEIISSAAFLMAVGQETTGTLLSVCVYSLSHHPEIQEKLYKELSAIRKPDGEFEYDELTSCQFLDAVISESLRFMNPAMFTERQFDKDYYLEKYKVLIPKNSKINLALHAIMNDPDSWPEPEKFKPERFAPENKDKIVPGSYCPFGIGPRHCLGMRFALTEAKLGLAKFVMRYNILPGPNTTFPPEMTNNFSFLNFKSPFVHLSVRE